MKRRLKSWNIWYNFKWNQPYLNRGLNLNRRSNSLNSATDYIAIFLYVHHLNLRHQDQGTQNDIHIANNINFLNAFNEGVGM